MPACYCRYSSCNGQLVDDKTRKRHKRFDDLQAYHKQAEHNADDSQDHPELELQGTIPRSSPPIDEATCKVGKEGSRKEHIRHYQTSTSTLQSLVELEQRATIQRRAMQDLKSRVITSLSTKSLLDEIKTHRIEMEATLATLTVLWCSDGSVATRVKEDLELQLQEGIEDMKRLKRVLASTPAGPNKCKLVIDIEKLDKDFLRSLEGCNSLLQRSLFQVLVQDSLDHTTRSSSNFRLKSLKDDFAKTMGNDLSLADEEFL
ncbi:hypothetical protein H4582DRAFT_2075806 [Lactarius indigo]|nr:hypothetical protein H4582DRAFT_2075806 [Lactarius indigo]